MRKFTASILIALTLWGSLILPARAVVPLLPALGYLTGSTLGDALIYSAGLHAAVAAIQLVTNGNPPASDGGNVGIQVQLDPYTPLTTPESAVPPATINATMEEQVVYTSSNRYLSQVTGQYVYGEACGGGQDVSTVNGSCIAGCSTGQTASYIPPGYLRCSEIQPTCPEGYTLNATENKCYLGASDSQVADAKIQVQRILDEFVQNPNDPDPIPPNVTLSPKDITIQTPERTTKVHINEDNTIDVKEIVQTPDGNTQENKVKISAPGAGSAPEVIGKSSSTYPGQSSNPPLSDGSPGGAAIPGTGQGESGTPTAPATGTNVLNLPDNLAKTEKQCGYDADHPCKVEGNIKINEVGTPEEFQTDHGDQLDDQFDELQTFVNEQQDGVGEGLENPLIGKFTSGQCTNPIYDVSEVDAKAKATIPICDYVPQLHPWLALFAYVMSALAIYRIWFTRQGASA